jgi:16S rRNA (uracil1498-N3)-methyltransferase
MARRLFFVDEVRRGEAVLQGEEAKHLTRVLRVEVGHQYEISDNNSLYLAEVSEARKELVVFTTIKKLPWPEPEPPVHLLPALFKFDHFEWMLEKATELGVSHVTPVIAERSEKGLERAAEKRIERWRRIVLEACQQARRPQLPVIALPVDLSDALRFQSERQLFLDEVPGGGRLVPEPVPTLILIGPEGGWADHEREEILATQWTRISLGTKILRAETAAIAVLAKLL